MLCSLTQLPPNDPKHNGGRSPPPSHACLMQQLIRAPTDCYRHDNKCMYLGRSLKPCHCSPITHDAIKFKRDILYTGNSHK